MIKVELQVPADTQSDSVVKVVEQVCHANGLTQVSKGTLASYPRCIHWHFKMDKQKGTLEITWWESKNRLWFKVADGRVSDWINESMRKLKKQIEISLKERP